VHNFLIIKTLASGSLITRPCVCVFVSARAREPWGEWENCESHYISDMHRLRQQRVVCVCATATSADTRFFPSVGD